MCSLIAVRGIVGERLTFVLQLLVEGGHPWSSN